MAALHFSSGGFSYAQAARGQTSSSVSQAPPSKATSGVVSPNNVPSEAASKTSWADEIETNIPKDLSDAQKQQQDIRPQSAPTSELAATRTKLDEKLLNGVSGISSPDLVATSSTAPKDDDILSAANGSSLESAWEIRSQASEPAWIADRKERQTRSHSREQSAVREPDTNAVTPQAQEKPFVLQEAAPPSVNPWLKRAEEAKAKATSKPQSAAPPPTQTTASALKENLPPRADLRRKANSIASLPAETAPAAPNSRRVADARDGQVDGVMTVDPPPRPVAATNTNAKPANRPSPAPERNGPPGRHSLPNLLNSPSLVSDESLWPTPDTLVEKERKDSSEKDAEEKREEDGTSASKSKKREWKVLPVTPNILFQTPGINEPKGRPTRASVNGERGGKSGSGRGRGGHRGSSHNAGGDRNASRVSASPSAKQESDSSVEPHARAIDADKQSLTKPARASSATALTRGKTDLATNGHVGPASSAELETSDKVLQDMDKFGSIRTTELAEAQTTLPRSSLRAGEDHPDSTDTDLPKPIPRGNSVTQPQIPSIEKSDDSLRQGSALPLRAVPDARKDSRPADAPREPGWSAPRSNKRGSRGRGGAGIRDSTNGHQSNATFQGNYTPDFSNPYGFQPPPYQLPRGNHPFAYPVNGRGGWNSRGGLRSQSIPIDSNYYQRMGYTSNGGPPHLPPINPYIASMYDAQNVPMTAFPYPSHMETPYLIDMVITQLEYYFSVDNLLKDLFLRRHMDSKGFVLMDVIANFNRVKILTEDRDLLKLACVYSEIIDIRVGDDGKERMRKAEGWEQFLLPIEQRDKDAQNDGPEQLLQLDRSQLPFPPYRGPPPASAPLPQHSRYDRRSYDSAYSLLNGGASQFGPYSGIPQVMYGDGMNGEETRGRSARSPIHDMPLSPVGHTIDTAIDESTTEPDAFLDSQVDVLTLVVKMSQQPLPSYHSLSSRTFSNGSIDSRTIMSESEKAMESSATPKKDGAPTVVNGNEMHLPPVPRRSSPNKPRSNDRSQKDPAPEVFWVKDQEGPLSNLPAGLSSEPYVQLRMKALDQRNHAATGNCPYDMDVLYQFWCHFLIRNFNHRMYTEFKTYAHEDVKRTNCTGIQNLIKFYAQSLSSNNPIRDLVVHDYVELVRNEPAALQGTAFKQLRSAWRNGALNLKNRKKLADIVDDNMKEQMDRLET